MGHGNQCPVPLIQWGSTGLLPQLLKGLSQAHVQGQPGLWNKLTAIQRNLARLNLRKKRVETSFTGIVPA